MSDNWGNVTAWSAGVSAVAATFLGVIATLVKKPLHNPLFIACLVIACLAFALLLWAGPAWVISRPQSRRLREPAESPQPTAPGSVITDRWRPATNGMTSTLTQLQYNSMSHLAYMRRDPLKRPPPSLRLGIVMTSSELDCETPDTVKVRARFLKFLNQPEIMDLVRDLAEVGSASWKARNENPRFNFGAVVAGLFIWAWIDDQRQRSLVTRIVPRPSRLKESCEWLADRPTADLMSPRSLPARAA